MLRTAATALTILTLAFASACSSSDTDSGETDVAALQDRLSAAKKVIDDAESVDVSLTTKSLPQKVSGLKEATGVGNYSPAFKGEVTIVTGGASIKADVISIGDTLWADAGITSGFLKLDPTALGAPDPSTIVGTDGNGVASILTKTTDLAQGEKSRDGSDILTQITGTVPGTVVRQFLPSADSTGTFEVVYRLDDDDVLRDATITGPFYTGAADVTYTLTIEASDTPVEITAPKGS